MFCNFRSLLHVPTWSVPLLYYPSPQHITPRTILELGHSMTYFSTDWCTRSQKEAVQVWEIYPARSPIVRLMSQLIVRTHLVLGMSFAHQAPNPMMPYGRLGSVATLITMRVIRARIWGAMPWYRLQQAGTLHVGNRFLVICIYTTQKN